MMGRLVKLGDFVYRKRYWLGLALLAFLVIGKFSGNSIAIWNDLIEPESGQESSIIIGRARNIRSDDWLVTTPQNLSQASEAVQFSSENTILGATDNLVTMYPNLPSKDLSILATPNNLGYLFLDTERALSLSWYLPYFVMFFSSFELLMILTKKRKLYALAGAVLLTLAPATQWWQNAPIPGYGALAVVLFYYLIKSKKWWQKLGLSILFGYAGFLYIMCIYPAWLIPYGYVYLAILIWILMQNNKDWRWRDLLYLVPALMAMATPLLILIQQNQEVIATIGATAYPGARMNIGGGPWQRMFTYVIDMIYPFGYSPENPCAFSQYLCLFPIPIVYSIYLMIKNRRKDWFLILANIVLICLSIWAIFPLPEIFSRITLLYMSTGARVLNAIGYLSVIELVYIVAHYEATKRERQFWNKKNLLLIVLAVSSMTMAMKLALGSMTDGYTLGRSTQILLIELFSIVTFLFLYNHKRTNLVLVGALMTVSVIGGATVHPINHGLSVFYDKPFAKKIRALVKEDAAATFMTVDGDWLMANYIAVNGARTLNTTNYVPNLDLYRSLDPELKYEEIYNRYEHVGVYLVDEETSFELVTTDHIDIKMNRTDMCKVGVDYLVTNNIANLEQYSMYELVYGEYNIFIYATGCDN